MQMSQPLDAENLDNPRMKTTAGSGRRWGCQRGMWAFYSGS